MNKDTTDEYKEDWFQSVRLRSKHNSIEFGLCKVTVKMMPFLGVFQNVSFLHTSKTILNDSKMS